MNEERPPERILRIGPVELWGRRRPQDETNPFWVLGRAFDNLRAAFWDAFLPTPVGRVFVWCVDRLARLLTRGETS